MYGVQVLYDWLQVPVEHSVVVVSLMFNSIMFTFPCLLLAGDWLVSTEVGRSEEKGRQSGIHTSGKSQKEEGLDYTLTLIIIVQCMQYYLVFSPLLMYYTCFLFTFNLISEESLEPQLHYYSTD